MNSARPSAPTLYYDGACPVCAREISMYRRQPGADALCWVDVSGCAAAELGPGLTRDAALARIHLRRPDGSLVSGAEAFVGLWASLPRWAWLARLFSPAIAMAALERGYRGFLVARRLWRRTPTTS